jgi:hypothetical protein
MKIILPILMLICYAANGIAHVDDKFFLSPGISKIHKDDWHEDNIFEIDLFLRFKKSPIAFRMGN